MSSAASDVYKRQNYGLLIPGCLLLGIGLGEVGGDSFLSFGDSSTLGLAFGFIAIFVIARLHEGKSHWWPLIPGSVLLLMSIPRTQEWFEYLSRHWQLLLVLIGALILIAAFRGGGKE